MKDAFNHSLKKSMREVLFERLPDYVFWDIKPLLTSKGEMRTNPYDMPKPHMFDSIFDYLT